MVCLTDGRAAFEKLQNEKRWPALRLAEPPLKSCGMKSDGIAVEGRAAMVEGFFRGSDEMASVIAGRISTGVPERSMITDNEKNMKAYNIIVLAKQVPDTRNVGKDAMKADGTVNRAVLPAIFNPEDLNALEQALRIKDQYPGSTVKILTMGPGRAAEIIREGLYRGADGGILLTDRAFAGSDTLATSYTLAQALKKMGDVDLIIAGRQAIDGDTAQVGPQVAEKLGWLQVTYVEEVTELKKDTIVMKRRLDRGVETVKGKLPLVMTVNGSAPDCRVRNAMLLMKYKRAKTVTELQKENEDYTSLYNERPELNIPEWTVNHIETEEGQLGLTGSPTKVKTIESVVLQAKDSKVISGDDGEIEAMMIELIKSHTIG